ncbi:MAG: hypothetical protein AAGF28_07155 [Pseudomonadota bacterium]
MALFQLLFGWSGRIDRWTFFAATTCQAILVLCGVILFTSMGGLAELAGTQLDQSEAMTMLSGMGTNIYNAAFVWSVFQTPLAFKRSRDMNGSVDEGIAYALLCLGGLVPTFGPFAQGIAAIIWLRLSYKRSQTDDDETAESETPLDARQGEDDTVSQPLQTETDLVERARQLRQLEAPSIQPPAYNSASSNHERKSRNGGPLRGNPQKSKTSFGRRRIHDI